MRQPRTLILELHAWKGFSIRRDLFIRTWCAGYFTIGWARYSLIDRLRRVCAEVYRFTARAQQAPSPPSRKQEPLGRGSLARGD